MMLDHLDVGSTVVNIKINKRNAYKNKVYKLYNITKFIY